MLTSDFLPYSETDSLVSTSSEYLSSEIDPSNNVGIENGNNSAKKRSKSRQRAQKKVKYWTLPTMSSGTFNPSMLTARQQLQYLAQKSKLGEESDSLELSPLRLDRIKFEEMKSLNGKDQIENSNPKPQILNGPSSPLSMSHHKAIATSPSSRSNAKTSQRSSKLKEEISSSPRRESTRVHKPKKSSNNKQVKSDNFSKDKETTDSTVLKDNVKHAEKAINTPNDNISHENTTLAPTTNNNDFVSKDVTKNMNNCTTIYSAVSTLPNSSSLFESAKNFFFNYNDNRRKHFENYLKDFAKRLGLSVDDEVVQKKKEEIINKGMI